MKGKKRSGKVPGAVATGSMAPGRYRSRYRTAPLLICNSLYFRSTPGAKIFSTKGAGAYRFDTPERNIPLSQSRKQIDLYRWKNFVFRGLRMPQFRFEVFNAPNFANFF